MGTSYSLIYSKFTDKITDYMFDGMTQPEGELIFLQYLKNAVPKFIQCNTDLTRDDTNQEFNEDLTELEQEILATRMLLEWIKPKKNNADLLEVRLGTKDFKTFSPSNFLKELRETKNDIENEIDRLIVQYSYNKDLEDLS